MTHTSASSDPSGQEGSQGGTRVCSTLFNVEALISNLQCNKSVEVGSGEKGGRDEGDMFRKKQEAQTNEMCEECESEVQINVF